MLLPRAREEREKKGRTARIGRAPGRKEFAYLSLTKYNSSLRTRLRVVLKSKAWASAAS